MFLAVVILGMLQWGSSPAILGGIAVTIEKDWLDTGVSDEQSRALCLARLRLTNTNSPVPGRIAVDAIWIRIEEHCAVRIGNEWLDVPPTEPAASGGWCALDPGMSLDTEFLVPEEASQLRLRLRCAAPPAGSGLRRWLGGKLLSFSQRRGPTFHGAYLRYSRWIFPDWLFPNSPRSPRTVEYLLQRGSSEAGP